MAETNNGRIEAFCDGVFAIALTLLIIDIKIPATASIHTSADLWLTLQHMLPSISAFILSFIIVLITWVNHHAAFKLVNRSSGAFIYANGLLLLTVVFIPFPTALLGEYIFTDHAAPAVILYNAVLAVQAIGWILTTGAALKGGLTKNETTTVAMRASNRNGYFGVLIYALLAVAAIWFPVSVAAITTLTWVFWLLFGIKMKHE